MKSKISLLKNVTNPLNLFIEENNNGLEVIINLSDALVGKSLIKLLLKMRASGASSLI